MIYCSDLRCKYRDDKKGKCRNKKVEICLIGTHTLNEGYVHLHKCKSYEESDFFKKYRPLIDKLMNGDLFEKWRKEIEDR